MTEKRQKMASSSPSKNGSSCICEENAYKGLIKDIFKICAYNPTEYAGFIAGIISILIWIITQFPQIVINYKTKSANGLSIYFLILWAIGDTLNLTACLLTGDQTQMQIYTAIYFLFSDACLLFQYVLYSTDMNTIWFTWKKDLSNSNSNWTTRSENRRRVSSRRNDRSIELEEEDGDNNNNNNNNILERRRSDSLAEIIANINISEPTRKATSTKKKKMNVSKASAVLSGILVASVTVMYVGGSNDDNSLKNKTFVSRSLKSAATGCLNAVSNATDLHINVGRWLGYASAMNYLGGRVFQIQRNSSRKSCEGVAPLMFFFAISANLTYGFSIIFMKNFQAKEITSSISFLLGSLGTMALDFYILAQSRKYGTNNNNNNNNISGDVTNNVIIQRQSSRIEHDWLEREASIHLLSADTLTQDTVINNNDNL